MNPKISITIVPGPTAKITADIEKKLAGHCKPSFKSRRILNQIRESITYQSPRVSLDSVDPRNADSTISSKDICSDTDAYVADNSDLNFSSDLHTEYLQNPVDLKDRDEPSAVQEKLSEIISNLKQKSQYESSKSKNAAEALGILEEPRMEDVPLTEISQPESESFSNRELGKMKTGVERMKLFSSQRKKKLKNKSKKAAHSDQSKKLVQELSKVQEHEKVRSLSRNIRAQSIEVNNLELVVHADVNTTDNADSFKIELSDRLTDKGNEVDVVTQICSSPCSEGLKKLNSKELIENDRGQSTKNGNEKDTEKKARGIDSIKSKSNFEPESYMDGNNNAKSDIEKNSVETETPKILNLDENEQKEFAASNFFASDSEKKGASPEKELRRDLDAFSEEKLSASALENDSTGINTVMLKMGKIASVPKMKIEMRKIESTSLLQRKTLIKKSKKIVHSIHSEEIIARELKIVQEHENMRASSVRIDAYPMKFDNNLEFEDDADTNVNKNAQSTGTKLLDDIKKEDISQKALTQESSNSRSKKFTKLNPENPLENSEEQLNKETQERILKTDALLEEQNGEKALELLKYDANSEPKNLIDENDDQNLETKGYSASAGLYEPSIPRENMQKVFDKSDGRIGTSSAPERETNKEEDSLDQFKSCEKQDLNTDNVNRAFTMSTEHSCQKLDENIIPNNSKIIPSNLGEKNEEQDSEKDSRAEAVMIQFPSDLSIGLIQKTIHGEEEFGTNAEKIVCTTIQTSFDNGKENEAGNNWIPQSPSSLPVSSLSPLFTECNSEGKDNTKRSVLASPPLTPSIKSQQKTHAVLETSLTPANNLSCNHYSSNETSKQILTTPNSNRKIDKLLQRMEGDSRADIIMNIKKKLEFSNTERDVGEQPAVPNNHDSKNFTPEENLSEQDEPASNVFQRIQSPSSLLNNRTENCEEINDFTYERLTIEVDGGQSMEQEINTVDEDDEGFMTDGNINVEAMDSEQTEDNGNLMDTTIIPETESEGDSSNDEICVNTNARIKTLRICKVETLPKPISIRRINDQEMDTTDKMDEDSYSPLPFREEMSFETLLDGSPYVENVNQKLTTKYCEVFSKIKTEGKRENIRRALDFDSDDADDDDNDPEYVPQDSDESEIDDKDDECIQVDKNDQSHCVMNEVIHNSSKDSSFEMPPSVYEPGKVFCNPKDLKVEMSRGRKGDQKVHFCIYCKRLIKDQFAKHLGRKHKDQKEVQAYLALLKKSRERLRMIDRIRGRGDMLHNTDPNYNQEFLILRRRPNKNKPRKGESNSACPNCGQWLSKTTLRHHVSKCHKHKSKKERNTQQRSRKLFSQVHVNANKVMRQFIIPVIRKEEIRDIVANDELIIEYGNQQCRTYKSQHYYKMIRTKMRTAAKLLRNLKKINGEVTDFASLYDPQYYNDVIKAIHKTAGLDEEETCYRAPGTAKLCGGLLRAIGRHCKSNWIKKKQNEQKVACEDFLHLLADDFHASVGKIAEETETLRRRQKTVKLPIRADIEKLYVYLQQLRKTYLMKLETNVSYHTWVALASATLTSIQVFNRRRAGEIERLLINDFNQCGGIEDFDKDLFDALDEKSQRIAKNYARFEIRGKRNRTVPVLLTPDLLHCMKTLVRTRSVVGIPESNPFVFGIRATADKHRLQWLDACTLMRQFSGECGASNPQTLRGTQLRKHIATQCIMFNLKSNEIADLANFMGHDEKIHKDVYRQPIAARDIINISQLLVKASRAKRPDGSYDDDSSDDEEGDEDNFLGGQNLLTENSQPLEGSEPTDTVFSSQTKEKMNKNNMKKRGIQEDDEESAFRSEDSSPVLRKKRQKLISNQEKADIKKRNGNNTIADPKVLQKRTKYLDDLKEADSLGENKKQKRRRSTPEYGPVKRRRWTNDEVQAANILYSKYFDLKDLPKPAQLRADIANTPALQDRTPAQIKSWINNIQLKKRPY